MSLSSEQIANLTRKADQAEVAKTHKSRWLTPGDAANLAAAMERGDNSITLGGMEMVIIYDTPARHKCFVKPAPRLNRYVPCGWYTTQLLQSIAAND